MVAFPRIEGCVSSYPVLTISTEGAASDPGIMPVLAMLAPRQAGMLCSQMFMTLEPPHQVLALKEQQQQHPQNGMPLAGGFEGVPGQDGTSNPAGHTAGRQMEGSKNDPAPSAASFSERQAWLRECAFLVVLSACTEDPCAGGVTGRKSSVLHVHIGK